MDEYDADDAEFFAASVPVAWCDTYDAHDAHLYGAINGNTYRCGGATAEDVVAWDAEGNAPACEHGLSASLCAGPGHYPADR